MSKELIVSAGRHETRVAILEDDLVVELFHEREKEYSLAGSIHKGRVTRVLPGMQSAFVDIGLDRDAFLYVSDFFEDNEEYDAVVSTVEEKVLKMERSGGSAGDRLEPVRQAFVAEPPAVESNGTDASVTAAPLASASTTPQEGRESRPDRGAGDRGGRGRRGRRRRGGRGSGLPESKFFSPRAEAAVESEPVAGTALAEETETSEAPEPVAPPSRPTFLRDDFFVLPGESLAKYSPSESAGAQEADAETEEPAEDPRQVPVESALPEEHPLAGFGSVASWVEPATEPARVETAEVETPEVETAEVETPEVDTEKEVIDEIVPEPPSPEIPQPTPAPEPAPAPEDEGLSAAELAEAEVADDAAEILDEEVPPVEEGPEPARIPTSLTAALREQGHRYPHRVSRRMRRKMRGGQPGEGGDRKESEGAAVTPPDATQENRTVSPQREQRPPREPREPREPRQQEQRASAPASERAGADRKERPERERPALPSISDLLKEGQEIIVQIAKEPLGQKGARITSHIALPGRFVVYMPTVEHVGVSRKIPSDEERQRLKRILQTHRQGVPGGFICRTAAESKSEEELRSDMHFLYNLWLDMRQKAEKKPAPVLLHHDLDLVQRILRDQLTTSFKTIWVDNEELYESILSFVQRFQPLLVGRVKLYTRTNPIFDEFGITNEIEKALRPKVWLKSGGYIVINQTEALVAIDINTGKYVGKSNRLEDTIVKINTDAIKEIVRQIRLRDLGGIIVVDFIDMDERKNRQKVMLALEDSMRADRAPYKILQFNDFGLVAITRKRVKQSLERTLCTPCTYCEGAGYIKSVGTVISEILQEAQKMRKALEAEHTNIVLRVNPEVARVLKSNQNSFLQEIEESIGKSVLVKSDPLLHQTKFDLA
jgi:ribonuclease G